MIVVIVMTVVTVTGKSDDRGDSDCGKSDCSGKSGDSDSGKSDDIGDSDSGKSGDIGDSDSGKSDDSGDSDSASKSVPASTRLEDPSRKGTTRMAKSAPYNPCPSREGPHSTVFFGEPAHGPPHVAGGASGPIGGCRDESRTDNPDLDLRHVFDRNNRKTDLI